MRYSLSAKLLLLLGSSQLVLSSHEDQRVLAPATESTINDDAATLGWDKAPMFTTENKDAIVAALKKYDDPVDAFVSLQPDMADTLAEPRLIHVHGEKMAEWMTEGDKLRLRRKGRKFRDITDFQELYADHVNTFAGKASKSKS